MEDALIAGTFLRIVEGLKAPTYYSEPRMQDPS
jgi:hypothetical protein